MGTRRIGIIASRLSRKNRKDPSLFRRLAMIGGAVAVPRFVGSQEELEAACEDFAAAGVDLVAIAGGDGTNGRVLTALRGPYKDALPTVGFLRGGTMNTVANGIGVARRSPEALLRRLVAAHGAGGIPITVARTLDVRASRPADLAAGAEEGPRSIFPGAAEVSPRRASDLDRGRLGFLAGTGAVYNFLATYYRAPDPTALTGADVLARSALGTFLPAFAATTQEIAAGWEGSVFFDEGPRWAPRRWLSVLLGTVPQIGLGFRPFPLALARRDRFHVIGIHGDAGRLAAALPRIRLGLRFGAKVADDAYTREAIFVSDAVKTGFMLDGDLLEHDGPIRVGLGPEVPIAIG